MNQVYFIVILLQILNCNIQNLILFPLSNRHKLLVQKKIKYSQSKRNKKKINQTFLKNKTNFKLLSLKEFKYLDVTDFKGFNYVGEISIGNPPQKLKVLFDTGSALIWINSIDCQNSNCITNQRFNYNNSSTFIDNQEPIKVVFKAGVIQGIKSEEDFKLKNIQIKGQDFIRIQSVQNDFLNNFDGVFGLSLEGLSNKNTKTFLEKIKQENLLKRNLFTFYLDNSGFIEKSHINFGEINKSLYKGKLVYKQVQSNKYWKIIIDKIYVDNHIICEQCQAIIDTGASLIAGPSKQIKKLLKLLHVNKNCHNIEKLSSVKFKIENQIFSLDYTEYILGIDGDSNRYKNKISKKFYNNCIPGFINIELPQSQKNSWILGQLFLYKYFTVFDFEKKQIGFALKNENYISVKNFNSFFN